MRDARSPPHASPLPGALRARAACPHRLWRVPTAMPAAACAILRYPARHQRHLSPRLPPLLHANRRPALCSGRRTPSLSHFAPRHSPRHSPRATRRPNSPQGSAYCTGRGEIIEPVPALPATACYLIKPSYGCSTPAVCARESLTAGSLLLPTTCTRHTHAHAHGIRMHMRMHMHTHVHMHMLIICAHRGKGHGPSKGWSGARARAAPPHYSRY